MVRAAIIEFPCAAHPRRTSTSLLCYEKLTKAVVITRREYDNKETLRSVGFRVRNLYHAGATCTAM